jgi:hypothetical protein
MPGGSEVISPLPHHCQAGGKHAEESRGKPFDDDGSSFTTAGRIFRSSSGFFEGMFISFTSFLHFFWLQVEPLFCSWIKQNIPSWKDCIVVSPDEGGAKRSVMIANSLGLEFAMIHNR